MGRWIRAILLLPGIALVAVPGLILWAAGAMPAAMGEVRFWLALALAVPGVGLAGWTMDLFRRFGNGTPAPWDPTQKLIVRGPYRYMRNPMIASVILLLAAEAVFFASPEVAVWMAVFFAANMVYFPLSEEKGLEKRFGDAYRRYKANVPRWLPRLTPWDSEP